MNNVADDFANYYDGNDIRIPYLGCRIKCLFHLLLYDVDLHPSVYSTYLKLNKYIFTM